MASHFDRHYCGKCCLTYCFNKPEDKWTKAAIKMKMFWSEGASECWFTEKLRLGWRCFQSWFLFLNWPQTALMRPERWWTWIIQSYLGSFTFFHERVRRHIFISKTFILFRNVGRFEPNGSVWPQEAFSRAEVNNSWVNRCKAVFYLKEGKKIRSSVKRQTLGTEAESVLSDFTAQFFWILFTVLHFVQFVMASFQNVHFPFFSSLLIRS